MGLAAVALVAGASPPAHGGPEVVRFHVAPDGSSAAFTLGSTTQSVLPTTRCEITGSGLNGPLVALDSNRKVGFSDTGIGVKSGGSQGTPCGRVDSAETLSITTAGTLDGRLMNKLVLDLELKGNAWVKLTLTNDGGQVGPVFQLQTGSSIETDATPATPGPPYMATSTVAAPKAACANPSDSGPDSGPNDNCLWTVVPDADFDTATFTVMVGEFSLEGSADFGGDPAYDTLLYLSNRAPVANDDSLTTDEDTPLSANVLDNDADPDTDPITVTAVNGDAEMVGVPITLAGGQVTVASDGALSFTPDPDFNGVAGSLTYTIADDEGATSTATVDISVNSVNDPPVATDATPSVDEDGSVSIPVATDVEGDPLTITCDEPANGGYVDNGDGSITYTPDPDFNGGDSFTCTANDGQADSDPATISVTVNPVNDPPVAADDEAETDEDEAVVIDVLANDDDIDGDVLTVTAVTQGADGSVAITNGGDDVTYTPDLGFVGTDTFTYTASDGAGGSDTATVTVETFQTICSGDSVTVTDDDVTGTFTRLTDSEDCKRYVAAADKSSGTVLFQPEGTSTVKYRGLLQLGSSAPPPPSPPTPVNLFLEYDPTGGDTFQPVQWCIAPVFDGAGMVTSATL
ncbi:MAG: tandem-95 repeat protein, partial [Ilumatobacter sp.]|nr:tandem-95 repeat protein [Ilumatobacter sp.]